MTAQPATILATKGTCDKCGHPLSAKLIRYDRVACRGCGKLFWALRPTRTSPLQLFPHPGLVASAIAPNT